MSTKQKQEAQNPLLLRSHRLTDAFAKSDDERDFYLDRREGFIIYVDLDKPENQLSALETELQKNKDRYCMIPKLTFYETKKIMEGFVNEKVYDIDTKEKLLDIIQSKDARSNFLEFLHDHPAEFDKWQQFYQERSRIRIIEWLRINHFHFVFEEDLELASSLLDKLKRSLFQPKVGKDIASARKVLVAKAKTYYSNEALNPRPKRGRPPKQAVKQEIEPQVTTDIYTTVPASVQPFLFIPDISSSSALTFSSKFETQEQFARRMNTFSDTDTSLENINQKLATLRSLSSRWESQKTSKEDDEFDEKSKPSTKKIPPKRILNVEQAKPKAKIKPVARPNKAVVKAKAAAKPPLKKKIISKSKPSVKAKPLAKPKLRPAVKLKPKFLAKAKAKAKIIPAKPKPKAILSKAKAKPKAKIVPSASKTKNKRIMPVVKKSPPKPVKKVLPKAKISAKKKR